MHKILVTGGAGYLGSILVPQLLAKGYEVIVLDKLLWGIDPLLSCLSDPKLTMVIGDIRDSRLVKELVRGADAVVNLAAIVGYPACQENPSMARETNLSAVSELAQLISPNQRLIQASTGSTYGQVDGVCTEETPINPLTLYGETKAHSEHDVLEKDGVALRFATVFGMSPRVRLDLIVNDITYQAVHYQTFVMYEGGARRTFLHSRDAARSLIFALENYEVMSGNAFNVGDNELNFTKREVAEMIKERHDFYLHFAEFGEDKDKRDYAVSYDKLNALGFRAEISMEAGIDELVRCLPFVKESSRYRNI